MERRGVPTATLTTDEFAALAKRECGSLGLPEMPLVMLPHPTSSLSGADAVARAEEAVDEVVRIITENAESLAEAYAVKDYAAAKRAFRAKQVFR